MLEGKNEAGDGVNAAKRSPQGDDEQERSEC